MTKISAVTLAAAIVVLSPGLDCYQAFGQTIKGTAIGTPRPVLALPGVVGGLSPAAAIIAVEFLEIPLYSVETPAEPASAVEVLQAVQRAGSENAVAQEAALNFAYDRTSAVGLSAAGGSAVDAGGSSVDSKRAEAPHYRLRGSRSQGVVLIDYVEIPANGDKNGNRGSSSVEGPAPINIAPGDYSAANNFKIAVVRFLNKDVYEVRAEGSADGRYQCVRFYINPASGEVFKSGLYKRSFIRTGFVEQNGIRRYSFKHGGFFSPYDEKVSFSVNAQTGELTSLTATTKVARWSLPSGWHSGPIKETVEDFGAHVFLRAPHS